VGWKNSCCHISRKEECGFRNFSKSAIVQKRNRNKRNWGAAADKWVQDGVVRLRRGKEPRVLCRLIRAGDWGLKRERGRFYAMVTSRGNADDGAVLGLGQLHCGKRPRLYFNCAKSKKRTLNEVVWLREIGEGSEIRRKPR